MRYRERGTLVPTDGYALRVLQGVTYNYPQTDVRVYADRSVCKDSTGRDADHDLDIDHESRLIDPLNGERFTSPTAGRKFSNYLAPGQLVSLSHLTTPGAPSFGVAGTTVLARTHPGRADVSLPVFIAELRDLPNMLRSAGEFLRGRTIRGLRRKLAGEYLSYNFGWSPLFSDLRKMMQFQASVDKRAQELKRLYSKGGLKRRIRIGNWSNHQEDNPTIDSVTGIVITTRRSVDTAVKMWGTVRWRPAALPVTITNEALRKQAENAIFGKSLQVVDAWNLIPWSWLVDWFGNIGDFLEAHNNRIPCYPGPINVMKTTETNVHWTRTDSNNWVKGGNSHATLRTLQRRITSGTMEADFSFLSNRQFSILGALGVTRARGFRS